MTLVQLRVAENAHPFIRNHGREALKFQFKLASYSAIVHLAFLSLLALSKPTARALASAIFLVLGFDYFFFPVFAGVQLVVAIVATRQALGGRIARYPAITW
jgi:uncharacterized Tic20 family protein